MNLLPSPIFVSSLCRDPQVQKDFVDALYDDGPFLRSLPKALLWNGIMLGQIGQASSLSDAPRELSMKKNTVNKFIDGLTEVGFATIREYDEVRAFVPITSGASRFSLLSHCARIK